MTIVPEISELGRTLANGRSAACRDLRPARSAQPCGIRLCERRGWDSNPRMTLTAIAGFQDRCVQPLRHPARPPDPSSLSRRCRGVCGLASRRCCSTTRPCRATATRCACCCAHLGIPLRAVTTERRRPLGPPGGARRAEPGAAGADARARRRARARRVERDHLVLRRRHRLPPGRRVRAGDRCCSGCSSSSTTTSRRRGRALLGRLSAPIADRDCRAVEARQARRATGRSTRWSVHLGRAPSSSPSATRSPTSPSTPTRTCAGEGGFDLGGLPGDRRPGSTASPRQPGHVPITA